MKDHYTSLARSLNIEKLDRFNKEKYKMGQFRPLFLYFRLFQYSWPLAMFNKNFADDGIRTADLWCQNDRFANWEPLPSTRKS